MAEHRTRRRGKELEDALYDATLAELAAVGYGGLTMEGIAARARTGKAADATQAILAQMTLYRP